MAQSRYERNVGLMILLGCLIVGAGILGYVVWDAVSDYDDGIEHVPLALWSSAAALFGMALIYFCVRLRDRANAARSRAHD